MLSLRQKDAYRIMCVGESTTGLGGAYSYPSQLERILNGRNFAIKFSVINAASSNTSTILYELEENLNRYKPDMVITMMGINDGVPHMLYEVESIQSQRKAPFYKTSRLYRFGRFMRLRIGAKAKEMGRHIKNVFLQKKEFIQAVVPAPSEETIKRCIKSNPENDQTYIALGIFYSAQNDFAEAVDLYKKAIKINPENYRPYLALGIIYEQQADYSKSEEFYKKSIELKPADDKGMAHCNLARCYLKQGKYDLAEESAKKTIALNPENHSAWVQLWESYRSRKEYNKEEQSIRKFMELTPQKGLGYQNLISLYLERGCAEEAKDLMSKCYFSVTIPNYIKLKDILDARGIKLVCVQYPMRKLEPLENIFKGEKQTDNIIFVDNQRVFEEAVEREGYDKIFTDNFGTIFGHCTRKGNGILAENIANTILKEAFGR